MHSFLSDNQHLASFGDNSNLTMQNGLKDSLHENHVFYSAIKTDLEEKMVFPSECVTIKPERNSSYTNYYRQPNNMKSIHFLLDELLTFSANKCHPKFEDVQTSKERLKCHHMSDLLFSVLSDLKNKSINLNGRVPGNVQENICKLQNTKYANLNNGEDGSYSETQQIRLDNMLVAEGILNYNCTGHFLVLFFFRGCV